MANVLSEQLRLMRLRCNLTSAAAAQGICTPKDITQFENGVALPNATILELLSRRFGCSLTLFADAYAAAQEDTNELLELALALARQKALRQAFGLVRQRLRSCLHEFALRHTWGRILEEAAHYRAALAVYRFAQRCADEGEHFFECLYRMGRCAKAAGELLEAHGYYIEALLRAEGAQRSISRDLRNKILLNIANIEYSLEAVGAALVHFNEALVLARLRCDTDLQIRAMIGLAVCLLDKREYAKAVAYLKESEAMCLSANKVEFLGIIHNNQAIAYRHLGQSEDAIAILKKSIAEKRANGLLAETVYGLNELTQLYLDSGDIESADMYNQEALQLVESLRDFRERSLTYELTAKLLMLDELYSEALVSAQESLASLKFPLEPQRGRLHCLLAELHLLLGDKEAALQSIRLASKLHSF